MANTYADTVLLEARYFMKENSELLFGRRPTLTQVLPVFLDGQSYIMGINGESIDDLKQATTQATYIEYLKKKAFTLAGTGKSCSPSGETGSSSKLQVTWSTLTGAVKHERKKYRGNDLNYVRGLAYDLAEFELSMFKGASGIDAILLAYLEANRTQINAISTIGGSKNTWLGTPNFYTQVANADINRFYNYLMADMGINNYVGEMYDIHNVGWMAEVAHYAEQGTANNVNTAYQFDGIMRKPTNLITPAGYFESTHYVIPKGGVAILFWNEPDNVAGYKSEVGEWTTMESQLFPGIFYDVFIKNSCSDTSLNGGAKQDIVIDYEMTLNYAIVKQPTDNLSGTETPIFKYNILTS